MNRVCYSLVVMASLFAFTCTSAQVVINEVFYHAPDEIGLEYVELFNHSEAAVDIGGWQLTEGVECQFPDGIQLSAGGYWVVANDAAVLKEFFKVEADGKFKKSLSNTSDKLQLKDKAGRLIDEVEYQDRSPWPISPDGYSASLERVYPQGASTVANWAASKLSANYDLLPSGTPGAVNSVFADAMPPSIESVAWQPEQPSPKESLTVVAKVADAKRLRSVELRYRIASPGNEGEERTVAMTKNDSGDYSGKIPTGNEANRLLRFQVVATSVDGGVAHSPEKYDVRPAYTAYVNDEVALDKIPLLHVFQVGKSVFEDGEKYRAEQQQERRGFGSGRGRRGFGRDRAPATPLLAQGEAAVIYTDPANGKSQVFDFVNVVRRKSGWKLRLHKDRPLLGMTTINVLYEPDEATVLNESLAYELYKAAGNASYLSGYVRLMMNGEQAGYHLYFEQPNGNFFRRNKLKDNGDLYKLIWMGNAELSYRLPLYDLPRRGDIAGRHEKKSNRHSGHDELITVIEKLENADSDDAMWKVIQNNIDVENMVNYFAVNSLLSHWDGFFNNYFVYYDRKGTGKFSLYPWDQDSTWSQRGGSPEALHEMPVFYGAEGATPDGIVKSDRPRERGGFGGFGRRGFGGRDSFMWRDGGDFSRPLLANPQFDKLFRQRLLALTDNAFNEAVFGKKIEELHASLEPEVRLRAKLRGGDEQAAVDELKQTMDALLEHLTQRRKFIRESITK